MTPYLMLLELKQACLSDCHIISAINRMLEKYAYAPAEFLREYDYPYGGYCILQRAENALHRVKE